MYFWEPIETWSDGTNGPHFEELFLRYLFTFFKSLEKTIQLFLYPNCVVMSRYRTELDLLTHPKCLQVYDDFSFSVLCRARYASQLKVLEAVCIRLHKPDLCKQKKHVVALRLFS